MPTLNRVTLIGNLTRDPEIKYTPKGTAISQFSIAVNRSWKNANGDKVDEVSFVDCECFENRAENLAKHAKKGQSLYVEGRLKQDTWDDKTTGAKRSKLKVIVDSWQFVSSKGGQHEATRPTGDDQKAASVKPVDPLDPAAKDDIPF